MGCGLIQAGVRELNPTRRAIVAPAAEWYEAGLRATWRSGDAADCKSVHAGSIPAVASNSPPGGKGMLKKEAR